MYFAFAPAAVSMPIRPDVRELLKQPPSRQIPAPAARAGWSGPEMEPATAVEGLAGMNPAQAERVARESLRQAATPDWPTALGVLALILLLRALRRRDTLAKATPVASGDSNQQPNAMRPAA